MTCGACGRKCVDSPLFIVEVDGVAVRVCARCWNTAKLSVRLGPPKEVRE